MIGHSEFEPIKDHPIFIQEQLFKKMISKIFLFIIGILYGYLAIFCAVSPDKASEIVNLERIGAGGRSEFFVVYGGLELAMAILFLIPLLKKKYIEAGVFSCLVVHATLVVFRMTSFVLYPGAFEATQSLAIGEIVILILSAIIWFTMKPNQQGEHNGMV